MTPQEAAAQFPGDPQAQANALAQAQALERMRAEQAAQADANFRASQAADAAQNAPAGGGYPAPSTPIRTAQDDVNATLASAAPPAPPAAAPAPAQGGDSAVPAVPPRLVAPPPQGGSAGGAPAPRPGLVDVSTPAAQQYLDDLARARAIEFSKRATPGMRIAAHTQETTSQVQRALGPADDTIAALEAERANQGRIASELAAVENNRRSLVADVAAEREQAVAAERQAALDAQQQRRAKLGEISASYDAKLQELRESEGKIDPGKFWSSKSDWQKMGLALATAFGALGQGLMRSQQNVALDAVKQGIADEVERQREAVLEGRKNLSLIGEVYQRTRAELGDEELARQAAYKAGLDVLTAREASISARANAALTTRPVKEAAPGAEGGAETPAPSPQSAVTAGQAQTAGGTAGALAAPLASAVGSAVAGPVLGPLAGLAASVGGGAVADRLRAAWDARQAEKAKADAPAKPEASVAVAPPKTETVSLHQLKAESDARLAGLLAKADLESQMRGTKSQSYQFVPEKVVGGSAGPNLDKILGYSSKMAGLEGDVLKQRGDLTKVLAEQRGKPNDGPPVINVGGRLFEADPRVPKEIVVDAEKRAKIAANIMRDATELAERAKTPGGMVPNDPALGILSGQLAGAFSNRSGSGAPSESESALIKNAVTPGPRQASAIQQLLAIGRFEQADAIRRMGGKPVR